MRSTTKVEVLTHRLADYWREHGQPDAVPYAEVAPLLVGYAQATIISARRKLHIRTSRVRDANGAIVGSIWHFGALVAPAVPKSRLVWGKATDVRTRAE